MSIDEIDFLSPKITFYYKGKQRHNSKFGGILTAIMLLLVCIVIIYYIYCVATYRNQTTMFYKKYESDVGYYPFNSSSIFHFFLIRKNDNDSNFLNIDFNSIRVIILNDYEEYETNPHTLENIEHWVYGGCNGKDFEKLNIDEEIKYEKMKNNSICIKYYYNNTEKKYYQSNNTNKFKWPYLQHGTAHENNIALGTIVEKCSNNSITNKIFGNCKVEDEINTYLKQFKYLDLKLLYNEIDLTNLHKPLKSFFYGIESSFNTKNEYYSIYNIYFHPLLFKSNLGFVLNQNNEINTFSIDESKISFSGQKKSETILLEYLYFMKNIKEIHQRKYDNILSVLPTIGGFVQTLYYIFYFLNFFYNQYALLSNTQILFLGKDGGIEISEDENNKNKRYKHGINKVRNSLLFISKNFKNNKENLKISPGSGSNILESDNAHIISRNNNQTEIKNLENIQDISNNNFIDNNHNIIKITRPYQKKLLQKSLQTISEKLKGQTQIIKKSNLNLNKDINKTELIKKPFTPSQINKFKISFSSDRLVGKTKNSKPNSLRSKGKNVHFNSDISNYSKKVTLVDIFKNDNHPMLGYFNIDIKQKSLSEFFEEEITFKKYLHYLFTCKTFNSNMKILETFHKKLLSEEYLYHSHILSYIIYQKIIEPPKKINENNITNENS